MHSRNINPNIFDKYYLSYHIIHLQVPAAVPAKAAALSAKIN